MRATGKEDAGRLKTGCGQRGERMRTRGKGLAKGWEKGRGKEGKVSLYFFAERRYSQIKFSSSRAPFSVEMPRR